MGAPRECPYSSRPLCYLSTPITNPTPSRPEARETSEGGSCSRSRDRASGAKLRGQGASPSRKSLPNFKGQRLLGARKGTVPPRKGGGSRSGEYQVIRPPSDWRGCLRSRRGGFELDSGQEEPPLGGEGKGGWCASSVGYPSPDRQVGQPPFPSEGRFFLSTRLLTFHPQNIP